MHAAAAPVPPRPGTVDGKAQRKVAPRRGQGVWDPDRRDQDPLVTILAQEDIRDPGLLALRHGRMGASPWNYYRGAAAVMAADLASHPDSGIRVQLCGDAHVLNFGLWNTPERRLAFDLRDFDETLPGPFEWDLKRFLTSLVVLSRESGLRDKATRKAVAAGFRGYREWIARYATWPEIDIWTDIAEFDRLVQYAVPADDQERTGRILEKRAAKRTSRGALDKLTVVADGRRQIVEKHPYRVHVGDGYASQLNSVLEQYLATVRDDLKVLLGSFDVVDAVQQVVGVGSVGMRVFLILAEERRTGDPLFLQVKQAGPSVYEPWLGASTYARHGERVVHGQRLIQSAGDSFLGWVSASGGDQRHDYYVRQFRDGKVVPTGAEIAPQLARYAGVCGHVLARAHARGGDVAAINDYLGKSDRVEEAFTAFAFAYDDQNARDQVQLAKAIEDGRVVAEPGWP
ncbi:DUF2252 domain-containing protein [Gordonia crocea]|uniref:DUF2252 domain-containing protein n=1 Tax=Gordonia crocea TaxID=589162 RepID=A0A7I9UZI5_9ACTN|nr:DUF2252 domain-containing protein [Gordonia crocea]GED98336.1 hypothetical protein nbrc107697_23750 [Gordonia crocea]